MIAMEEENAYKIDNASVIMDFLVNNVNKIKNKETFN